MAESSLIINATNQRGDKSQRSVTFASDSADRDKMLTFARGINALTTNNFVEAKRIQKVSLDDDPNGGWHSGSDVGYDVIPYPEAVIAPDASKTTPTITLTPATVTKTAITQAFTNAIYYDVSITYNGDGTLYVDYFSSAGSPEGCRIVNDNGYKLRIFRNSSLPLSSAFSYGTYSVRSTATDTCNQASATFTVTND